MKKPSYKVLATGIIIIIVFAALLLYFCPMEMSDLINDKNDRGMSECHNR